MVVESNMAAILLTIVASDQLANRLALATLLNEGSGQQGVQPQFRPSHG
jgi:hypothetical protein